MFYKVDFTNLIDFFSLTSIRGNDVIEILIISFIVYYILKTLKDTRAWIIAKGCLVLFLLYGFAYFASFKVITYMAGFFMTFFAIALVIMFQPELRRILETLGTKNIGLIKIYRKIKKDKDKETLYSNKSIEEILKAVNVMSKAKTGALILIQKKSPLNDFEESGIKVNADISNQLIVNIFEKNTPLHDGAIIIRNNRISAATCYLPLSDNRSINKSLGTRHRAAIGASEQTDALIIVVSEETGAISIVEKGKIKHNVAIEKLREALVDNQVSGVKEIVKDSKFSKKKTKLSIISLVFGAFLWFFLTEITDPIISMDFNDIPVTIINENKIEETGYVYEIVSGETVDITVKGPKSYVNELKLHDFVATANASEISITNSMNIKVNANKHSDNIEINTHNSMMTILLEEAISIECPIVTEKIGTEYPGYFVTDLTPSIKTITITGSKSKIKTIDKAVAQVSVSNQKEDFTTKSSYLVYDKNGNVVDLSDCEINTKIVEIQGNVNKVKEVKLNITAKDSSLSNCEVILNNLKISDEYINISAEEEILNELETIDITIDISSYEDKINTIILLENYLPDGIYFAGIDSEFTINAGITRTITEDLKINSSQISIKNGDGNILDDEYIVTIQYDYTDKNRITIENIVPYIDLKNVKQGNKKVNLEFENDSKFKVVESPEINVTVMME